MSIVLPAGWSWADYASYVDPILADSAQERTEWIDARTPAEIRVNMGEYLVFGTTFSPLPRGWDMTEFTAWANALIADADAAYDSDVLSKIPYYLIDATDSYIDAKAPVDLWADAVIANGGTVSAARKSVIQSFIAAEMAAGTWALTDDYWALWAENPIQALTSIKQRRLAVAVNAPVFLPNRHYEFDGATQYIDTGFVPSTHAVAMSLANGRIASYERANLASNGIALGAEASANSVSLVPRNATNRYQGRMLSGALINSVLPTLDSRGWIAFSIKPGPETGWYRNGVLVETIANPPTATSLPTVSLAIGARNSAGTFNAWRASPLGMATIGASLTAQQELDQFNNVQSWAIAVGAAVVGQDDVTLWANAVIGRGGTVSSQRRALMTNLVNAWKSAGVYDLIDDAWMLVAENPTQALVSLKQRRLATAVNSPAFTADQGYAFGGTTYVDTLFTPSAHAVAMTGTSMHIAVYERTNVAIGNVAAGCVNVSTQNLMLIPRATANVVQAQLNSQAVGPGGDATIVDSRGLTVGSRNGTLTADVLAYKNGVAVLPWQPGTVGAVLPTTKIYIGARSDASNVATAFRAATEGFVSVGAAIPAASQPAFYNAVQSFMSGAGAAIAPWSPLDLGASLIAWWDAERLDLIARDGNGRVSSWKDVVGGYDLTQPVLDAQPIYSPTSFGGRPGITPDGVNDFLELAGSPSWLPAGSTPSEDWHLVDQPTLPADTTLYALGAWGNTSNSNSRTVFRTVVTGVNRALGNVTTGSANLLVDFSGRRVVRFIVTATGHTTEVDGLAPAEFAVVPATIATRIRTFAGATSAAGSFGRARLNVRVIAGPLTAQQAYDLRQWMKGRIS